MRNAYKISADKSHMIRALVGDTVGGKVINITVDRTHIVCGYDLAWTGRGERHIMGFLITKWNVPVSQKLRAPRIKILESLKLEDVRSEAVARGIFTELLSRCQLRHHQSDGVDMAVSETVLFSVSWTWQTARRHFTGFFKRTMQACQERQCLDT